MIHSTGISICPICGASIKWEYFEGTPGGYVPEVYRPNGNISRAIAIVGTAKEPLMIEVRCYQCNQLPLVSYTPNNGV